jgi:phosphatidylglycerol:prolipoprotein diacylglycerol transferase
MYPILLALGPIKLYSYGLMIAVGFLLTLQLIQRDARKIGVDGGAISEMGFYALCIGVMATRLAHILMYSENYTWSQPLGWISPKGGYVFQGAIPAVILYMYIALKRRKIPFWTMPDVIFPYVPLGHAFGRVGCFLSGCCHGKAAPDFFCAVRFPPGSWAESKYPDLASDVSGWSLPVHPTQIYSVVGLLCIFGIMLLLRKKWHPFEGFCFPLYLILYGISRFIVEAFRGDGNPTNLSFGFISNQQVFCLIMMGIGVVLFFWLRRRSRRLVSASV